MGAALVHAPREGRASMNRTFEVSNPTFQTVVMPADIEVYGNSVVAANLTHSDHSPIKRGWAIEGGLEAYLSEIRFIVIVVFLF